jgi:hypothetical protein
MRARTTRRALLLAAAAASTASGAIAAQRRYAVLSFVADQVEIVVPVSTGSYIDRNVRRELPDPARAFEGFVLVAAGKALERADRGATASLLGTGVMPFHAQPERLFDGDSVALPGALVDAIERAQATHLVLITKHREEARLRFYRNHVGSGRLRGIGYYVDPDQQVVLGSGAMASGFIAAYVFVRLHLVDVASGKVVARETVTESIVESAAASDKAGDPWDMLDATQKVRLLRGLLEREVGAAAARLLLR